MATLHTAHKTDMTRGSNARGIVAMLFSIACFVSSDTLVKQIGAEMPIGQMMFLRGLFAAMLVATLAVMTGDIAQYRRVFTPIMALRTVVEVGATLFFFAGLLRLPFADAAAIGQFTPLAVTAGAALFLNEPVGWRRWLATVVGLIGVLLIIRPGTSAFNPAALLIVACVFFVAVRDLVTRVLGNSVPALLIILLSSTAVMLSGIFIRPLESWIDPSAGIVASIAVSALGVTGGYYGSIIAMRCGDIAVVAPFRYTSMLFALVWAYVLFNEVPDWPTWVGIAIVVGAGGYTFHREMVRKREAAMKADHS